LLPTKRPLFRARVGTDNDCLWEHTFGIDLVSSASRSADFAYPVQAWAKHVDGACALLNLRGEQQFQSNLGRRLFHQFYGVILLVALETGRPVHEGMHKLYRVMTPTSDYNVHGRAWTTRLVDLLHSSIYLNQDLTTDPKTMVQSALNLDREVDKIKALMPSVWEYETVYLEHPSEHLYGKLYHIYLDPWIAQMWNNVNSCRICLFKIVRENLTRGWIQSDPPVFTQEEYNSIKALAEDTSRATAAAIIASVPQITGMIPFPDLTTAKRRASDPAHSLRYTICAPGTYIDTSHTTHMLHLIWPLYAAGGLELITAEMRQWIIEMLHHVALRIGNRQAVVLADELKEVGTPMPEVFVAFVNPDHRYNAPVYSLHLGPTVRRARCI
jgi:hypothetical protein